MRRPRFLSPQERVKSPVNHHVIQLPRKQAMLLQIGPYVYDCTCVIGKGQYSVVYRGCEQNKPTNLVAVKVITIQPNNPIQMYMIENEINILKQLDSPYILKMLHHQQINKNVFIVTEYCNKGDLLQKIQRSLIPEEEAIQFTLQIAKALQVIHANNIMHGDVKSANILLSDHCTLADFGFAQRIDQAQQTFIIGTPLYMAPEVLFENEINCQADMWSLGCVLYEMVYGLSPFYSENNDILKTTLAEFKEHGKLTFPNTGVSRKIQALILYLIKVDPKERLTALDTVQLLEPRSVDEQIKINGDQLKIKQELMNLDNKSVLQQPSITQLPPNDSQSNSNTQSNQILKPEAGTPTHDKQLTITNNNHSPEEHRRSTKNSNSSAKRKLLQNVNQKIVTQVMNTQHTQTSDSKKLNQRNSQPSQQPTNNSKPISLLDLVNYFYKVYQLIMNAKELKLAFIYLKLVNIYYMAYLEEQSKQQKKVVFYSCQNDYFELEREIKNKYPQWLKEEEFQKIFHCKFTLTQDFLRHSLNYINRAVAEQQHDEKIAEKIKKTLQILTVLGSNEKINYSPSQTQFQSLMYNYFSHGQINYIHFQGDTAAEWSIVF